MSKGTLTSRLFLRITPTILVTIVCIGVLAFHSASKEINNIYDAQLINDANVLWSLLQDEFQEAGVDTAKEVKDIDFTMNNQLAFNEDADDYADAHMFRAWKADKMVMFSSLAFPASIARQNAGFSYLTYKNELWRVYVLPIPKTTIAIEVGEKIALRDTLVNNILLNLFYPLLVLIPIVSGLAWVGIRSGLGTIRMMVAEIRDRSPSDLAPLSIEKLPQELIPLGESLNQLLTKLKHSLTSERRFSDNAAHQLRTPLAGLKLLLQMLATEDSIVERKALQADLMNSLEKANHLVEQLLHVARVSHQPVTLHPVSLYHSVASVIAELGLLANEKHQHISLEGIEDSQVNADEPLLHLLVSNIIENAIKYTPDSGTITVSILPAGNNWLLSISDTGCGIPADQRDSVFQRFYRVDTPQTEGTGLGLAIVAEIIERLQGNIALKTPIAGTGLLVEILLPKA